MICIQRYDMMHTQMHHLRTITVLPTGGKLHFSL